MPRRAYLFIAAVCTLALVLEGVLLVWSPPAAAWSWWGPGILLVLILLAEAAAVEITRDSDQVAYVVSVAAIPHLAAALLLPPPVAALLAGIGMVVDEVRAGSPWIRVVFNVASTASSVGLASAAANMLGVSGPQLGSGDWRQVLAFFVVALSYYMCNTLPVATIAALVNGGSLWRNIMQNARFTAPAELSLAIIGGLAAFVWDRNPYWVLAGLFPCAISQLTLRYIAARNRKSAHFSALDSLGRQLSTGLSVEQVFRSTSAHLSQTRSADGCFLYLDRPTIRLADGAADEPASSSRVAELTDRVRATGASVCIRDASTEPGHEGDQTRSARSWLALPLGSGDGYAGCLGIVGAGARAFSADDLEFFGLVAERVGLALEAAHRAEELVQMAYHDTLTGLPNRALFLDRLEQVLLVGERHLKRAAVLLLDLDNFKLINDSLGHHAGDGLLQQIGEHLRGAVRAGDTVARLGGDEFIILLPEIQNLDEAADLAERIAAGLRAPFSIAGRDVVVSTSIGVAISRPGDRPQSLLRGADLALYRAKADGRCRYAFFNPQMEAEAIERMELESALRVALDRHEFQVYYQPIVRVASGDIVGWEALLRWHHPQRGLVSPAVFIPVAEDTGLIVTIGHRVLEEACRQARTWQTMTGDQTLTMSVNVSARQFQDPELVESIERIVRQSGLAPERLKLEITETAVMHDAAAAVNTLHALKKLGIQLAIDDFGTGYSSLAYLKRFPVDTLKIDQSFVNGLGQDAQDTAIVRSVMALASTLELNVTAEGIETPSQLAQLVRMGCDFGQGYLFGRPVAASSAEELLVQTHRRPGSFLSDRSAA